MTISPGLRTYFPLPRTWRALAITTAVLISTSCAEHVPTWKPGADLASDNSVARPVPTTCQGFTTAIGEARTVRRFPNLTLAWPVQLVHHPSQPYWYVVEQGGKIRRFADSDDVSTSEVVLDMAGHLFTDGFEDGLLGFAFDPNFETNGRIVVKFTAPSSDPIGLELRVEGFTSSNGGATFDLDSRSLILTVEKYADLHHGGAPSFGRDGYLYVPVGDGTLDLADDPAQDLSRLGGKVLRVALDESPYRVPDDNPFVGVNGARGEIWALGLRNPWGWSFDPTSGALWVADTGNLVEELNRVVGGANYGWPNRDGSKCSGIGECDPAFVDPFYGYENGSGAAIIGGPVYTGKKFPKAVGSPVFGDFVHGRIQYVTVDEENEKAIAHTLLEGGSNITTLTLDLDGEILFTDRLGRIQSLEPVEVGPTVPPLLSKTGCVDVARPRQSPQGMIPYEVNMPLWSDRTDKVRWLALPADQKIRVLEQGELEFPIGTVMVKNFFWQDRPIETRLYVRHASGDWSGYSYEWREDLSDADLLEGGAYRNYPDLFWQFPSRAECGSCHTGSAGRTLGTSIMQLNRPVGEPFRQENQLKSWERMKLFDKPLGPIEHLRFPDRNDLSAPAKDWARAYLHANCAHCHQPNSTGRSTLDMRNTRPFEDVGCGRKAELPLGLPEEQVIATGRPDSSSLLARMGSVDWSTRMPRLGSFVVDDLAVERIRTWITETSGCGDD